MNKPIRLATGNKVEIIDIEHPDFGKRAIFIELRPRYRQKIDHSGKVISSKVEPYYIFKLEDAETEIDLTRTQWRKI